MSTTVQNKSDNLKSGHVYRTSELRQWSENPSRLARQWVQSGRLVPLGHGLYLAPTLGKFGPLPPENEALLNAFLGDSPWVLTGSTFWNALGLGSTAVFSYPWVYNTKRTGTFELGGRTFLLRRTAFPIQPSPEWYAIDLLRNSESAGVPWERLERHLKQAVTAGQFDREKLWDMALQFGTHAEQKAVKETLVSA